MGTGFVITGALFAAAGFVPECFLIGAVGSFIWTLSSDDKPLLFLNTFMCALNIVAFINN